VSLTYVHAAHQTAAGTQQTHRNAVRALVSTIVESRWADLKVGPYRVKSQVTSHKSQNRLVTFLAYGSEEIVSVNPLGSVTSNARVPHSVSWGSVPRVTPAFLASAAS
jgi:hypothetical protein